MPNTESVKMNNKHLSLNSDNVDEENANESLKNEKLIFKTLSPAFLSPINTKDTKKEVFNKKRTHYSHKVKNKIINENDNYQIDDRAVTPDQNRKQDKFRLNDYLNLDNIKINLENQKNIEYDDKEFEYTEQMKNYDNFDNNLNKNNKINFKKNKFISPFVLHSKKSHFLKNMVVFSKNIHSEERKEENIKKKISKIKINIFKFI